MLHSPSSRVGAHSCEILACSTCLLCQHAWAAALWCPRPLTPCLVSSSHQDSFLPTLTVPSPAPRAAPCPSQQVPHSLESHQWDMLSPPCLLAAIAAVLVHPSTPPLVICAVAAFWIINRIYPVASIIGESRGKGLGIVHKDASLLAQGNSLPSCHTFPGTGASSKAIGTARFPQAPRPH